MRRLATLLLVVIGMQAGACGPTYVQPAVLAHPRPGQIWAVAPFHNESGTTAPNGAEVADAFAIEAQQVVGVTVLPVNRVVAAMREAGIAGVTTAGEARMLMNMLNLDGLIVGTITAYDPYHPPIIGLAVELHQADAAGATDLDPRHLQHSATETHAPGAALGGLGPRPLQAAGIFEADDHRTLEAIRRYAHGRTATDNAYGDRIYEYRMDLYTQFACYQLIGALLAQEQMRNDALVAQAP
jgi:hypothetical protein